MWHKEPLPRLGMNLSSYPWESLGASRFFSTKVNPGA